MAKITALIILFIGMLVWRLHVENTEIIFTGLDLVFPELPPQFEGYRVLHLSDFHSGSFGPTAEQVLSQLKHLPVDCIVFTGDCFDQRRLSLIPEGLELLEGLAMLGIVYYVVGNHEGGIGHWQMLEREVQERGVHILRNRAVPILRDGQRIWVIGLDDPNFFWASKSTPEAELVKSMKAIPAGDFTLLLSHRPEQIGLYSNAGVNLALAGHAHGGQVRLPWIGGLIAPGQGLFPRYSEGVHQEGQTWLVVSRGLGNSVIPQRLFNRPEIVVITLHQK